MDLFFLLEKVPRTYLWKYLIRLEKKEFKPFDKVLVRQSSDGVWDAMLFCNYSGQIHKYRCLGMNYMYCIPYEGNEHLLGTTINPEEHE